MAATNAFFTPTLSLRRRSTVFKSSPQIPRFDLNKPSSIPLLGFSPKLNILQATQDSTNSIGSSSLMSDVDSDPVPIPIVLIDQDSDPVATIVQLSFGDRLGALIDTMKALKDLGLDVSKGTVTTEGAVKQTKLFITLLNTGRKVEDPDMLERIRLTVIDNLLKYHPESSERLAMGEAFGIKAPVKKVSIYDKAILELNLGCLSSHF